MTGAAGIKACADAPSAGARGPVWQLIDTSGVGGIERHIAALAAALGRRGIATEIVIYQDHGPNAWRDQLSAAGLTPRILPGGFGALRAAMRAARPSLVHTHGYKAGVLGRLAAHLLGAPAVSTFHSGERGRFPVSLYQQVDAFSCLFAKRIAVSDAIRGRLPYAATVVPNFVAAPERPSAEPLPRRIGFVGRLSAEKGPDRFCALAEQAGARRDGPEQWEIYGDGPMRAELERRYGDRVRFHGMVADMSRVWPRLGLLAMTSRAEGLPMAALEAMAAGVPILASRVGGLPGVVAPGQTGWLVDSDRLEHADLAEAMAALGAWRGLDEAGMRRMRAACWRRLQDRFSEASSVAAILAVYAAAAGREFA